MELPVTLAEAVIPSLPSSAYYIPEFITTAEEQLLLDKVSTKEAFHV